MNWYEQKQADRRERLEAAAQRKRDEAEGRHDAAMDALRGIEPGQPILVGHHSERAHRRAIQRCDDNMRKAIETGKEARDLAHRAASVGKGGISSDDPDAIAKLRSQLEARKRDQERMKQVNTLYRKRDTEGLAALGLDLAKVDAMIARAHSWDKKPYPGWELTNNNAQIKRIEKRLESLAEVAATPERQVTFETHAGDITIIDDPDENRVRIEFPKAMERFRATVKLAGWRWSPTRTAWVRKRLPGVYQIAHHLAMEEGIRIAGEARAEAEAGSSNPQPEEVGG